jgi:hypothetical protein
VRRVVITTHEDDAEGSRISGYRGVRQLLGRAALDDEAVDGAGKVLHLGHRVVLADVAEIAPSEARVHLEQVAQVA